MTSTTMKTTLYGRISSTNQKDGVSLDAQLDLCRQFATKNGITAPLVVQEVHTAYDSVPVVLATLANKRNHRVIFYAVDRFSRNVINGIAMAQKMLKNKCHLVFMREKIILTSTEGPMWLSFVTALTQGEAESKAIGQRVKGAINYLKTNGFCYSHHVPFGSEAVPDVEKPNRKRLRVEGTELLVLKFISLCRARNTTVAALNKALALFAPLSVNDPIVIEYDGRALTKLMYEMTFGDIADLLNGYESTYRGKAWTPSSVAGVYNRSVREPKEVEDLTEAFSLFGDFGGESKQAPKPAGKRSNDDDMKVDNDRYQAPPPDWLFARSAAPAPDGTTKRQRSK